MAYRILCSVIYLCIFISCTTDKKVVNKLKVIDLKVINAGPNKMSVPVDSFNSNKVLFRINQ